MNLIGLNWKTITQDHKSCLKEQGCTVREVNLQEFVNKTVKERYNRLREEYKEINDLIKNTPQRFPNFDTRYVTFGCPPDHIIELPLQTENQDGLNPEAMIQKIQELTAPNGPKFDLYSQNCSKTTLAVLEAGAKQNPLLASVFREKVLGAIATPQKVLTNARRAQEVIDATFGARVITRLRSVSCKTLNLI